MNTEWRIRYEAAVEAARRAGQLAHGYFDQTLQVEWKHDDSPVTVADREAEQLLRQTLGRAFPDDGFLGEEYGDTPGSSGFRWVLDPIDGTRNFVRGIPVWATLVGLEYKGEQIAGVAEAPGLRTTWRACAATAPTTATAASGCPTLPIFQRRCCFTPACRGFSRRAGATPSST